LAVGPAPPNNDGGGWTTYHGNLTRSGDATAVPALDSIRTVWSSPTLDGQVYAEPLVWRNLVIVATENDTVYALASSTGTVVWRTHVGMPVPISDLPCGNVSPLGILSTPTIQASTGRLFAVAEVLRGGRVSHQLVALSATTGKLAFSESADPASMTNPRAQQQRGALAVSDGRVYVVYGGLYGDCASYYGLVVSAPTAGGGQLVSYRVPTPNRGAIWDPAGPSIDSAGDVYVTTGNGSSTTTYDEGDSVLELSPGLQRLSFFAPSGWARDNRDDLDLGSTGPVLLPDGLVFQVGKEATGYLLRQGRLGGIGGSMASAGICFAIGGTANAGSDVYVSCRGWIDDVHVSSTNLSVAWSGPVGVSDPPIVAGGLVWSVGGSTLYGLSPSTGRAVVRQALDGQPEEFVTPSVGDGLLIVPTGQGVEAFAAAKSRL
jgi:outer membrane protein assembly factor BamB